MNVIPGGIAEMFMLDDDRERVYLQNRFGFVKVALQTGAHLVPTYHFGSSRVLSTYTSPSLQALSRSLQMSLVFFYDRFYLPIPRRHPILTVVGEPIPVPKVEEPTRAQVAEYHAKFLAAMEKLYNDHRGLIGWDDRPLSIE